MSPWDEKGQALAGNRNKEVHLLINLINIIFCSMRKTQLSR